MRGGGEGAAGVDLGSVSIAVVLLDSAGSVLHRAIRPHGGRIHDVLGEMLADPAFARVARLGVTERGREFFRAGIEVNEQVAQIAGVVRELPAARAILSIGGETFGLLLLDENGRYRRYISNPPCAAGTGSFLDQQAARLGLAGGAALSRLAEGYSGDPPKIATRCAVFAKTDLVHIQQQGYGLPAIAAGLCRGVAGNIADTLFHGVAITGPVAVIGGVSQNRMVVRCLEETLQQPLTALPEGASAGACGAARTAATYPAALDRAGPVADLLVLERPRRSYHYAPLARLAVPSGASDAPAPSERTDWIHDVETTRYAALSPGTSASCLLGIDVGSTSTKAALVAPGGEVLLGLYTRTGGQPIEAVQRLTRVLEEVERADGVTYRILGTGTTGSGRAFIRQVTRADRSIDEITAHARAAVALDPRIDTIIEIGGQDAKFTVLKDGHVVFAVMNYVCAAGTGSFLEEQAKRLEVSLEDFSLRAMDAPAPLISDRCTVFMERDLNHLLSLGYRREELMAAALRSVRDNYLSKVAHRNKIGRHIAFQGATARNRALVRAFEEELERPIFVSRLCHLTGAIGVCLQMADAGADRGTRFRKDLHQERIVVGEYVCDFCKNHCKIKTTALGGETLGWGYLCGRDERDDGFRRKETSGFDLLRDHRKVFDRPARALSEDAGVFREFQRGGIRAVIRRPEFSLARLRNRLHASALEMRDELFSSGVVRRTEEDAAAPTVGLPAALSLLEYIPFWNLFFRRLGFVPIPSTGGPERLAQGRAAAGAAFCAPLVDLHGHVRDLARRADYLFLPQLLGNSGTGEKRAYCYYSHFAVPLVRNLPGLDLSDRILAPVLDMEGDLDASIRSVYESLPPALRGRTSYDRVEEAFRMAWDWFRERRTDLGEIFRDQFGATSDIGVVLLGRPYLILNPSLHKGIPQRLADLGVQSFTMDMIPTPDSDLVAARDFLQVNHWHYGDRIIRVAETVARTPGLFPVYLTAFRCSPDAFVLTYFRAIMDHYRKPYLILQLDEHEAAEGYATRLEAAVETFRTHASHPAPEPVGPPPVVRLRRSFEEKTYLLWGYDAFSARLIQGAFLHDGIRALPIEHAPETIGAGMRLNDGQCLPIGILAHGIRATIRNHGLDPARVAFISNTEAPVSCNLPQFSVMVKQLMERMGEGMERVDVLVTGFLHEGLPTSLVREIYLAYLVTGLVQRMAHRIRPRARDAGQTDAVLRGAADPLFAAFASGGSKEAAFEEVASALARIDRTEDPLPAVGIVGDLFVRDDEAMNQGLVAEIESAGAEAVTMPFVDVIEMIADRHFRYQWSDGRYLDLLRDRVAYEALRRGGAVLREIARPILGEDPRPLAQDPDEILGRYGITNIHTGEMVENLLKVYHLRQNRPDLRMIVNVNPIFCCPGLVSEALFQRVEKDLGIPIVSLTFDGTAARSCRPLRPYLHYLRGSAAGATTSTASTVTSPPSETRI